MCAACVDSTIRVSNACREPIADFVSDKTRANFCGYLELRDHGGSGSLDDLFGLKDGSDR